jgi:hypothetical protein
VVAEDGSYREVLRMYSLDSGDAGPDAGPPSCFYAGAVERSGTYDLSVSAPGYQTMDVTGVVVTHDQCHVIPRSVTITLRVL